MQQAIKRRDVYQPGMSAVLGGQQVDVSSMSLDRELSDSLPGAGRFTAATGEITATVGDDVDTVVPTPWDPGTQWPPAPESAVDVALDMGAGPVAALTNGRATRLSGGTGDRAIDLSIADQYQSLDRSISWDALAAAMPRREDVFPARYVSLGASAVTDMILRHCGWYATPPKLGWCTLSVPAMGTMWPEYGRVDQCIRQSVPSGYASWLATPWGVGVLDVQAYYTMGAVYSIKQRGRIELAAMAGLPNGGTMYLGAYNDAGVIRLVWTDTTASLRMTTTQGTVVAAVSLPRTEGSVMDATVERITDTTVKVTLSVDGTTKTGQATVPAGLVTDELRNAVIVGNGVGGGFQIAFPDTGNRLASWMSNVKMRLRAASRNTLVVLPSIAGANCADLLQQQCAAEAATFWIDETGVLQWWDLARLEAQAPVATLTSADDLTDEGFTWSHDLSSVKSRAVVKWREPLREWSSYQSVDLWHGAGRTLTSGEDPTEEWINVPDDEVWIMPHLTFFNVGVGTADNFNLGYYSWYGGVIPSRGPAPDTWAYDSGTLSVDIERVTDAAFKLTTSWKGTGKAIMRTPDGDTASFLWRRRRDVDLPILRGKGKFTFGDQSTLSTQTGPASAPEHEIDAGWWIQNANQAQHTADYAGARVTVPQPVFSSISIIPTPGLQLGDMVTVEDTDITRLTIRGLIVQDARKVSSSDDGLDMSHAIAIRPTSVAHNGTQWVTWAATMAAAGDSWADWGATHHVTQWQQWGAAPLGGTNG